MTVEGFDGRFGHGLSRSDEPKASVHATVVGQHNAIRHVAMAFEQVSQFIGSNLTGKSPQRTGTGCSA